MDQATFDRNVRINLKGSLFVTGVVIPTMKAQGHGRLIAISSRDSLAGGMPISTIRRRADRPRVPSCQASRAWRQVHSRSLNMLIANRLLPQIQSKLFGI
jgi:NAD(P)-dependent dehydrogenase (short-subunit alcohol dehydrogenase family)